MLLRTNVYSAVQRLQGNLDFFLTVHMALRRFFFARGGGGGVHPKITNRGLYRPTGRDFEAPDLERGIHVRGVF